MARDKICYNVLSGTVLEIKTHSKHIKQLKAFAIFSIIINIFLRINWSRVSLRFVS